MKLVTNEARRNRTPRNTFPILHGTSLRFFIENSVGKPASGKPSVPEGARRIGVLYGRVIKIHNFGFLRALKKT
jgi:hypothetical protein